MNKNPPKTHFIKKLSTYQKMVWNTIKNCIIYIESFIENDKHELIREKLRKSAEDCEKRRKQREEKLLDNIMSLSEPFDNSFLKKSKTRKLSLYLHEYSCRCFVNTTRDLLCTVFQKEIFL